MSFEKELEYINEELAERKETILTLLVPIAAATDEKGKPVFTAARAVARAVAVADALARRLDKERDNELNELLAESEDDGAEPAAPPEPKPPVEFGSKAWVVGE